MSDDSRALAPEPPATRRDDAAPAPLAPVIVVAAVIERDGRFLLTLRTAGTHLEGHWEFPGGKVHTGETQAEALIRELREELDIDATIGDLVHEVTHAYPEKTVSLFFYRCAFTGVPTPMQGQEMRWVRREDLHALPFPEADRDLIYLLTRV
ncbi:MAG: (deoxy)nucleoside triphosphate pyrophosphohydrolase [Acidobacteria bacterium]|nr:(deoxy)nucleoside triphosphate pyrophosphohydrolase [Acidobacteriota bacterium]